MLFLNRHKKSITMPNPFGVYFSLKPNEAVDTDCVEWARPYADQGWITPKNEKDAEPKVVARFTRDQVRRVQQQRYIPADLMNHMQGGVSADSLKTLIETAVNERVQAIMASKGMDVAAGLDLGAAMAPVPPKPTDEPVITSDVDDMIAEMEAQNAAKPAKGKKVK